MGDIFPIVDIDIDKEFEAELDKPCKYCGKIHKDYGLWYKLKFLLNTKKGEVE